MTTTLERLSGLRLVQVAVAALIAALFIVAAAGMASADSYGGSSNYPAPAPPSGGQSAPDTPSVRVVGKPSILPVTGSDALGLAALGVGIAGAGAGLVVWTRRRSAAPSNA